jgi:beta-glucosidase
MEVFDMELYKDPHQPIEARVEDLLSRMTLEEKVSQLCGDLPASFIEDGKVNINLLREKFPDGHGRFTQYSIVGLVSPEQISRISNQIQRYFVDETRLGIPVALQAENLCGYPAAGGTLFPAMINMGCTWEPELASKMSEIIGQESRSVGITSAMSPVIDIVQDPRWGRTYETFGEDPYLTSQFGVHYVKGMQEQGVSCIAKHFLGYSSTQGGLNTSACRMGKRELYEIFATPFEAANKLSGLDAVMANYGEIDGLPVIVNKDIIENLLRKTMGFDGVLTSDGAAVLKTYQYFKVAKTYEEAGYLAKKAGTDTEIPVGAAFRKLPEYVRSGELSEECIDASVRRVLTIKFKHGLFENPYCEEETVTLALSNPTKNELSEEIAAKSLVLLKNDGVLPLKKGTKVALIGPHADSLRYPVSGYTYPAYIEMMKAGASGQSTGFNGLADEQEKADSSEKKHKGPFAVMFDMFSKEEKDSMNDMESALRRTGTRSLKEVLTERFSVSYAQGCSITGEETDGFADAVEAARQSDVIVMACGGNCGWVNVTGGEGKDRQFLDLPGVQQKLLEAVTATGKPVVLVLYGPGVFAVNWAEKNCGAILQAFMPGPFAGKVITNVIDGTANPGGKMTMTVPRTTGQIPIYYNHRIGSGYNSGGDITASSIFSGGYVDGPADPLYCFGHGLSYTTFELSDLEVSAAEILTDGKLEISCKVKNTGETAGDEVVQLYTSFTEAHVTRPSKQLSGFRRVSLKPGEEKQVVFHLDMAQMGYYNENMEFVVEPGNMHLMMGTSSANLTLKSSVLLTGKPADVMGRRSYVCRTEVK